MWNLIVKIFERRWLITILVVLITLVCSWFYQNSREEIIHKLLSMKYGGMLPSGVEITEEKVNKFMEEQILMPWIDFFLYDMLDPIFGKFLNEIFVASIFACFGLCILYTICDMLLILLKEFEINVYYPLRKMWLRNYPCIISKISDGTYKIESSSNAVHQLGANDFAQYMANCIIEDFVRFHELNMPTKKRNKTMRRLTNACENVLWISPRDLRKRIKIFGQFKGTLDIGHDVQIDLAHFYNDIPLNITIKNCLVYSTVMKIFSIILKIVFSPIVLFTNLMKLIVNSARCLFQRLTASTTTSMQQTPASEETSDSESQREEIPQIEGTQIYENSMIDDQIEDMTTNSFMNDEHLIQNDQITHETEQTTTPALEKFRGQTLEVQLNTFMNRFDKTNRENQKLKEEVQQLKFEVEQLIDARTCVICMDKEILYLFMPCKHLVSCEKCALKPSIKECPVCRKTIQKRLKTYMS